MRSAFDANAVLSFFAGNLPYDQLIPDHRSLQSLSLTPVFQPYRFRLSWTREILGLSSSLERSLGELARLESGWDGDEADPVRPETLGAARALLLGLLEAQPSLREPALLPTPDGSIQLEWHDPDRSLELGLVGTKWVALGVELDRAGEVLARFTLSFGPEAVEKAALCYTWFVHRGQRRAAWPSR